MNGVLVLLLLIGLGIGISSYVMWSRRWPGLVAGFDSARCSDPAGLARWVGGTGMILGAACVAAAIASYAMPQYRRPVGAVLALVIVTGTIAAVTGCGRFVRR